MTKRIESARERLVILAARRSQASIQIDRRTEDLRAAVVRADVVGMKRSEIARLAGVRPATVYAWLTLAGRPMSISHGGKR